MFQLDHILSAKDMHLNSTNQSYTCLTDKLKQLRQLRQRSREQSECSILSQLSMEQSECSIYRVHTHLRNVNPTAYEPEVIAIGPYHRGKDNLQPMEHHKLRYLLLLLQHKNEDAETYVAAIAQMESEARKCYAEHVNLGSIEFTDMLVLDGCFIIQLVRMFDCLELRDEKDPIFQMDWIRNSLIRDLMLFENQVPFFVLCQLYDLIEAPNQRGRLTFLLVKFFEILCPGKVYTDFATDETEHLLGLIHRSWVPRRNTEPGGREKEKRLQFINSAIKLRDYNVKFEINEDENLTLFDIDFNNGVMRMVPLIVEDRTEAFFRNLIAYEQCFQQNQPTVVTDYVKFMDCLIDSSKDVEILSRRGIIENWLGDGEAVAKMVNKLTDSVTGPGDEFIYFEISEKVNKHCKSQGNRWMAMLRRNYLNSPWAVLSIIAAVILLLLTATQTLFTVHKF